MTAAVTPTDPPTPAQPPDASLGDAYVAWWNRQNDARTRVERVPTVEGVSLRVSPGTFSPDPRLTYAPTLMCKTMPTSMAGMTVLDLGAGCGVLSIVAALRGATQVIAVDLSEGAIDDTRANVAELERVGRIEAGVVVPVVGDLYDAVPAGVGPAGVGPFDLILANLPIAADAKPWHELGPIAQTMDRCIAGLTSHLKPAGRAMIGWASFGPPGVMPDLVERAGLSTAMTHEATFGVTWSVCTARRG